MLDTLSNSYMIASRMDGLSHMGDLTARQTKAAGPRRRRRLGDRLVRLIEQWRRANVARDELHRLSPRLLADAGLSEDERRTQLARPFWTY